MPRAAPGEIATGAVRRKLPEYLVVPGSHLSRRTIRCPSQPGMGNSLHLVKPGTMKEDAYTQLLSVYKVERGRLGKVVSLVGDCRPPPPGNPLQPPSIQDDWDRAKGRREKVGQYLPGEVYFSTTRQKVGGYICPFRKSRSFNILRFVSNLKILNSSEYFKKNRSYYYCTEKKPVLEFGSFHSHLCGLDEVELPSIAITNVLGMQG